MLHGDEAYHSILISHTYLNQTIPLRSGQKPGITNE